MAIKTLIRRTPEGYVVQLGGKLDFETSDNFRESLNRLQRQTGEDPVVFDLAELQFVGSSGITKFVQALCEFNTRSTVRPRYTNVKIEFKKIILAFDETNSFEFWDSTERALKSFDN